MTNKKIIPKIFHFIVVLLLVSAWGGPIAIRASEEHAAENLSEKTPETIRIRDVQDLLKLAENCTMDSWSQDKEIILESDIDLEGVDFLPIPTFGGVFDGKGHSVIGLEIDDSTSPAGLFAVLQEGAIVKNLNVSGKVIPAGQKSDVGGIVGENHGQIFHCTFTGTVSGETNVGGIAGVNEYTGTIQNCRTSGIILGESKTGGIVGYNQGVIIKAKNDMDVNNESMDPAVSIEDLDVDISVDVTKLNTLNLLSAVSDTGGVAGYSTGIIDHCSNDGTVGYPHIGYNVGGIAGRSCGYIFGCVNEGKIFGRKDVGGIVGQMEPYILVKISESGIAEIKREMDSLDGMLNTLERHTKESSKELRENITATRHYIEQMAETMSEDTLDEQTINNRLTELTVQIHMLTVRMEQFGQDAVEDANTFGKELNNISNQSGKLSDTLRAVLEEAEDLALSDLVSDTSAAQLVEETTYGKVSESENNEAVYGDVNVGGIAGNISLEQALDPEDDLTVELSMEERRQYEMTAIIYKCMNTSTVTAKKDYAGGICGRMDLGLITTCEGYGYIHSESGDYVGGIAGLTGSTIQKSYAKCSLSGRRFVGGIVGTGITEDVTGESSLVSQCYSLVDIKGFEQFAGAIAGAHAGAYLDCYFVSEDMAGIDRISYAGQAEPITYEELIEVKGLPDAFKDFTLTFVAGEEVVYTTTFAYGDSFEKDIYPTLPGMDGVSVHWDITELRNLKKDTVVTAVYSPYLSTLASEEVREENRPIFLAEGQFEPESFIHIIEEDRDFVPEDQGFWAGLSTCRVVEQWSIEIPKDGLLIHTLRYLVPEEETGELDIYVKQDGQWKLADREVVGCYLLFNMAGTKAEIAVVAVGSVWQLWLLGIVLLCLVIGGGIWMVHKKKSILKWLIWIVAGLLFIVAAVLILVLLQGKVQGGVEAYQLLKNYIEQPVQAMKLKLQAELGGEELELETNVLFTELDGRSVTCIEQSGISFFYSDNILYLENGKAYQASEVSADYSDLLKQTVLLYEYVDIETIKDKDAKDYIITVKEDSTRDILGYLLPSVSEDILQVDLLQVEMSAEEDALQTLTFISEGDFKNEKEGAYHITARFEVADPENINIEIPDEVRKAILSEKPQIEAVITKDVFRLYAAWKALYDRNPLGMQIYLNVDCGPLALQEDVTFLTVVDEDTRINCVQKNDFSVYFTEDAICGENGYAVTTKRAQAVEVADLLGIAYVLCLNGTFSCTEAGDTYIYSLALDEEAMKDIALAISQESADMGIRFENGHIQVRIKEDEVESILFACDGSLDVLLTEVSVAFSAELDMADAEKYEGFVIPQKVRDALHAE